MELTEEGTKNAQIEEERDRPPVRDYTLWSLLSWARDMVSRVRTQELAPKGITPRQFAALLAIRSIGAGATPAEVSRRLLREPHSVSSLLRRMQGIGLVSETKDLDKKNLTRVSLTTQGEEALARSMGSESLRRIFSSIPDGERHQLQRNLEIILIKAVRELSELDNRQRWDLAAVLGRLSGRLAPEFLLEHSSSVDE